MNLQSTGLQAKYINCVVYGVGMRDEMGKSVDGGTLPATSGVSILGKCWPLCVVMSIDARAYTLGQYRNHSQSRIPVSIRRTC